jgi:hypothetical protein
MGRLTVLTMLALLLASAAVYAQVGGGPRNGQESTPRVLSHESVGLSR